MPLVFGAVVILLVAFFSVVLGVLVAATIGIKRTDRGHFRALRHGRDKRTFSGAGRSVTGLRFLDSVEDDGDDEDEFGRPGALV
ncbi:hypothetical protein ACFPZ0_23370 [Streptomonospora nanhaiensis]|uniref:Uncharacterized protein n=1 Tax=Streptomonospora nanhaiensis TaxID=1323731 RepID=A0A853BRZ4_9ACTN|nr:hypothetical protein [Streptomonospora nanhaiensis]MBV2362886.1 hypothetical protein [Streptomonospora nanhaiensis]MBX9389369.1 hypothetical protein [Streptomonospora nanhaiensis]NYI97750.1 hypothetical protein [Streptomonospora nanhaiensis]